MRHPFARVSWGRLFHHAIDLLQGQALGLGDQEVRVNKGSGTETTPNKEDGGFQVAVLLAHHVRCDDGNDGVPKPVGGGGESDSTGSDGEGEDFADKNPGPGTPGGGKEKDEDCDEGNLSVDRGDVVCQRLCRIRRIRVGVVEANGNADDGNEKLADKHTEGTPDKKKASTELLDGVEGDGSGADVN